MECGNKSPLWPAPPRKNRWTTIEQLPAAGPACIFQRMKTNALIVSNPDILGGTPVFAGTRVPVKNLTDYLEAGDSIESFLDDFPTVSRAKVVAFLDAARAQVTSLELAHA